MQVCWSRTGFLSILWPGAVLLPVLRSRTILNRYWLFNRLHYGLWPHLSCRRDDRADSRRIEVILSIAGAETQ